MNMLLIGPRGCGKTTVGRLLALRTGRGFVDLDERVLAMFGISTVVEVWEKLGEAAWRDAESEALAAVLHADGQVVALGGGTPAIDAARAAINAAQTAEGARVVYLSCSVEELARRLSRSPGDRPALTPAGLIEEITAILSEREPIYRSLADIVCDVTASTPQEIVQELARDVFE